ncbi:MAG: protein kinase, partial [Planctomycetes bacterium]|nr:protein kinase [Planctomycetota bacterium]
MPGELAKCRGSIGTESSSSGAAPTTRLSLGEWCIRQGLATRTEIETCLREQRKRISRGEPAVRMGELLVERGILTHAQVAKALADQHEEIRQCLHCGIRINVPIAQDGARYRCPRCDRSLVACPTGAPLDAVFEPPRVAGRCPLPDEVQLAFSNPDRRFGKYLLLNEAGRGGIGRVYRAWDTYLGQFVALKRLLGESTDENSGLDTASVQSLLQEARSAIRLRHPGIVSVFDVGRVDREYYISMEYIEGETLHDRISAARRRSRTSPLYEDFPGVIRSLAEVARAVHYAHTRPLPVIHCDLKPGNILIDREGHAHVVDFGLARTVQQEPDEPGEISGTPSYMSPEQASGRTDRIDARTDVYALGAILYELLGGRPPFVGMTLEILDRILVEEPVEPTSLRVRPREGGDDEIPAEVLASLEKLCLKCLDKEREQRPQNLEEVAAALERLPYGPAPTGSPETPLVTAPPSVEPAPCPPRRRSLRWVGWAAGALLALGSAAGGLSLALRQRSDSEERRIVQQLARFRPERALEEGIGLIQRRGGAAPESSAATLVEEALRVAALKDRLLQALRTWSG